MEEDKVIPWVKRDEILFKVCDDYFQSSNFGWGNLDDQLYGFISGYKESADTLVDIVINSKDIKKLDTYVFPICFLYRHSLELMLKSIFLKFSMKCHEEKIDTIKKVNHNLKKIWEEVKPVILEYSYGTEKEDVQIAEDYIFQFDVYDNSSYTFRYPMSKKLQIIHEKNKYLDLKNLKERMDELFIFLNAVEVALDERITAEVEMLEYMYE